jgi:predicted negative regulator of RcsB-dependent stress response
MNKNVKVPILVLATLITGMLIGITPLSFSQATTGSQGNVHLDAAIKALQSGDTNGALMHMNQADKTLTGAAKMHLDAAIKALQSGDTNGALMHLQQSQKNQ